MKKVGVTEGVVICTVTTPEGKTEKSAVRVELRGSKQNSKEYKGDENKDTM